VIDERDLVAHGVDIRRIGEWIQRVGVSREPITSAQRMSGGSQNVLVLITSDDRKIVLRRPPVHKRAKSDDTMRREAEVLRALAGTAVPHAPLIAACSDLEVTGAAFYLMDLVAGTDIDTAIDSAPDPCAAARAVGFSIADAAAALAGLELTPTTLDRLGRRDLWLERQVGRWRKQLDSYEELSGYVGSAELGSVDEVADWLERHRPDDFSPGLIHGDFHLGNLMYSTERLEVCAIVDWELATVGDPLLDLAHMLATWPDGRRAPAVRAVLADLPSDEEFVARYVERSGTEVRHLDWYRVLACYRLGIILEGTKARADHGKAAVDVGDRLHEVAVKLFDQARDIAQA